MCFSSAHFFFCILHHATICGFIVRRYFHAAHTHLKLENILLHLALADAGVWWWWWCRRRAHNVMLITRLYYLSTHIVCSSSDYKLHTVYICMFTVFICKAATAAHTHSSSCIRYLRMWTVVRGYVLFYNTHISVCALFRTPTEKVSVWVCVPTCVQQVVVWHRHAAASSHKQKQIPSSSVGGVV